MKRIRPFWLVVPGLLLVLAYLLARPLWVAHASDTWIAAPSTAFVGLSYRNPPGGTKTCLNAKTASCALAIARRESRTWGGPSSPSPGSGPPLRS
jgi:hypothetical protein